MGIVLTILTVCVLLFVFFNKKDDDESISWLINPKSDLSEEEKLVFLDKLKDKWNFSEDSYWVPLNTKSYLDTICFHDHDLFKIDKSLLSLVKDQGDDLYFLGEGGYYFVKNDDLVCAYDRETIVTNKELDWVIYWSHEHTVAVGGSLLVKEVESLVEGKGGEVTFLKGVPQ